MPVPLLSIHNLCAGYGGRPILRRINFQLHCGQILGVLGQNGCGKTTLLRCINAALIPQSGQIFLKGLSLTAYSRKKLARTVAAFACASARPEAFNLRQYVQMGRFPWLGWAGFYSRADEEIAAAALLAMQLADFAEKPAAALSAGQWQMAGIARALAQIWQTRQPLLLLDEPGANLDIHRHILLAKYLTSFRRGQGSAVAAMHDCNMAALMCTHLLGIKAGSQLFFGPAHAVFTEENLSELYDWPVGIFTHPEFGAPQMFVRAGNNVADDFACLMRQPALRVCAASLR